MKEIVTFEKNPTVISAGALSLLHSAGFDDKLVSDLLEITDRHAGYTDVVGYTERLAMYSRHMVTSVSVGCEVLSALTINHMFSPMAGLSSGQCMNNVANQVWDMKNTFLQDIEEAGLPVPLLYCAWDAGHAIGLMDFDSKGPNLNSSLVLDPNFPRILSSREYINEGRRIETIYTPLQNDFPLEVDYSLPLLRGPIAPEYLPGVYIGRRGQSYYVASFYIEEHPDRNLLLPALKVLNERNIITAAINIESRNADEFQTCLLATLSRFNFSVDPTLGSDPYYQKFNMPIERRIGIIEKRRLTKKL